MGSVVVAIIYLLINFFVAKQGEYAAGLKGYGKEAAAFGMCFWLGIVGLIYVATLPDRVQQE